MDLSASASTRPPPSTLDDEASLSPLEQEVLDEYAKLVGNLDDVRPAPPFLLVPRPGN